MANSLLSRLKHLTMGDTDSVIGTENVISTYLASVISGWSQRYIRMLCERGSIKAVKLSDRVWLIDKKSLEAFVKAQQHRKRD